MANKLYYCKECKKIFKEQVNDGCCTGSNVKKLKIGTSVNVLGTKLKGKVYKIKDNLVTLIISEEGSNKFLKDYEFQNLKKIL